MQKHKSSERANAIAMGGIKLELLYQKHYKKDYKGKELKKRLKKSNDKIKKLKESLV